MIRYLPIYFLLIAQTGLTQSNYQVTEYTASNGLPNNVVDQVVQDGYGFIWASLNFDLVRFDGYEFKIYNIENSKQALEANQLYVDQYGTLWVNYLIDGNQNEQGVLKYDINSDSFIRYNPNIKSNARHICQDKEDHIWLGSQRPTGGGLYEYNPDTKETINYVNSHTDSATQVHQNRITSIEDRDSCLYLTTTNGLWRFHKAKKTFSRPDINPKDTSLLFSNEWLFRLNPGVGLPRRWAYAADNTTGKEFAIKLDSAYNIISKFQIPKEVSEAGIIKSDVDNQDVFWYLTKKGIYRYDYNSGTLELIDQNYDVAEMMVDRDRNLWLASFGIIKFSPFGLPYQKTTIKDFPKDVIWSSIQPVKRNDEDEYFAITAGATSVNSVWTADLSPETIEIKPIRLPDKFTHGGWFTRSYLGKEYLWIAALGNGTLGIPIDKKTGLLNSKEILNLNKNTLNINYEGFDYAAFEDGSENLWIGTVLNGFRKVNLRVPLGTEGSVEQFNNIPGDTNSLSSNQIDQIFSIGSNSILISTSKGIDLFKDGKFQHLIKNESGHYYYATSNELFISTSGGIYRSRKAEGYKQFEKIYDEFAGGILGDQENRIWILTPRGLEVLDLSSNIKISFSDNLDLKVHNEFSPSFSKTSNGLFGFVVNGALITFDASAFKISQNKTYPLLTNLILNHKPANVNDELQGSDFKPPSNITSLDELVLDYQHNNFSIEFSAMEMIAPQNNLYRHKLAGYDKDWIETDYKERKANYSNLPAGDYVFKVKASNHHGVWSDYEKTLKVKILPPPWRTWWAYTSYGLIIIGLLYLARSNIVKQERLNASLQLAKVEQEKEHFELEKAKEVDRVKTSFFTNISHEFRTPLTLIKGPVQNIIDQFISNQPEIDRMKIVDQLKLVQRNSDLLLKLINQLLDLAKLESGTLKVEKSEGELYSLIRAIASSFSSFAAQKNVTVNVDVPAESYSALFDKDKLETILINLVNNAIKFTPANGAVTVKAFVDFTAKAQSREATLRLYVADTGIGIPQDQQQKIFERFHQVSEAHKEVGTGIGLAFVKELTEFMGGTISVTSEVNKGTEFMVTLPVELVESGKIKAESEEADTVTLRFSKGDTTETSSMSGFESLSLTGSLTNTKASDDNTKPHILVVEDNTDVRAFIIDSLGDEFYFLEAENGKVGLEVATREIPDLIISDVMMPEMDGITMAGKIKSDIRTSHIPLILLTAKSTEDSKLSGLQSGADDYLTKPFNKNELLLKVRNGVNRQLKLREKLRAELMSTAPRTEVLSADEQFLNEVKEGILKRLSDEQLSVESLADDIGMSRVQLYRKISGLTGMSVNELIRKLRLQRAAQLLQQKWGPVSQVAYEVGFSNLSYFSKVFKDEFGVLPSEYNSVEK